jgi:hypothetical protein
MEDMMTVNQYLKTVKLILEDCPVCGCVYGLEKRYIENKREQGGDWYCPNGHCIRFVDKSITEKNRQLKMALKQAKDNANWWKEEAESKARSLSATKGVLTKTKNRIANGVCPCCKRQFTNLQRHMETKHPKWTSKND